MKFIKSKSKYILYSICLAVGLWLSSDVYPEYENFRYALFVIGVLACIFGKDKIVITISVIEFLISFPVMIEKINRYENQIVMERKQIKESVIEVLENCDVYKKEWAIASCNARNFELKKINNPIKQTIATQKIKVTNKEIFSKFPSMIVFIIFSCAIPLLGFFAVSNDNKPLPLVKEQVQTKIIDLDETIRKIIARNKTEGKTFENLCLESGLSLSKFKRRRKELDLSQKKSEPKPDLKVLRGKAS